MVKPANTEKILAATGRAWPEWITYLDERAARDMPHPQLVDLVVKTGLASDWWSQMVAVAYEQHIGRRQPGQRADGQFNANVSRTISGTAELAFRAWEEIMSGETIVLRLQIKGTPTTSQTKSGLNWRCKTEDGSAFAVNFLDVGPDKVRASASHEGLADASALALAKLFWGAKLDRLRVRIV